MSSSVIGPGFFCQAPDPNPQQPRFKAPQRATDTHFHILGPPTSYPYVEEREYTPPDALPSACRRLFDTLGIQRAVLIQPSVYGEDNTCMMESARQLGVPARMIVVVPFSTPDNVDEAARQLSAGNFDIVAVGRALLSEPAWPNKLRDGRRDEIREFTEEALASLVI